MQADFQLQGSPVFIGPVADFFPKWLELHRYSRVFVVVDENTERHCLPVFEAFCRDFEKVVIAPGEGEKNLESCGRIWNAMQSAGLDRKALVVNLGGGVIGDMGGFCAATWKRGVDFVQMPTTLLSMTDAAIGGKLGVDFQGVKNVIGLIKQPAAVFIDPEFLNTLADRELKSGMAEMIKHASIAGRLSESIELTSDGLRESVAVKVRIVNEDPYESGLRMLLNFGHTIGHAVESYFLERERPLTHGEAVAVGMICECHIEAIMEGASPSGASLERILLSLYHLPDIPPGAVTRLWELMQQDKKNTPGKVRMALPGAAPYSMKIMEIGQDEFKRSVLYYNELR